VTSREPTVGTHVVIHPGVTIEDDVEIQDGAVIGKAPRLGPRSDAPKPDAAPTVLEQGCVVCCLAVIAAGARIGAGAIVGDHAFVREGARVGAGSVIGHGSAIGRGVRIGDRARLQNSVVIAPGWDVGEEADIGPGVLTTTERWHPEEPDDRPRGGSIGPRARIGAGVVLMPGVEIGADAVVGAGAVVRESVPAGATAVGLPARLLPRS